MELLQVIYIAFLLLFFRILYKVLKFGLAYLKLSKSVKYVEHDIKFRYSKSEIPKEIDYIVIGAGTSGLSTSAVLSKLGYKVLVLEKIGKAGGCLHTFKKEGFEFDTGYHYVGNDPALKFFLKLICSKQIDWQQYNHYDSVKLGDKIVEFKAPTKNFFETLYKQFPEDTEVLKKYEKYSRDAYVFGQCFIPQAVLPKFIGTLIRTFLQKKFSHIYGKSTAQVFDELKISKNRKLDFLLNITPGGSLGADSTQMPFIAHALFLQHYNQAGHIYPRGGPRSIVESVVSTIVQNGGKLLTKAPVEQILIENNQVVGVKMANAEIRCKNVISTVGYNTTQKLVPEQHKQHFETEYHDHDGYTMFNMFYGLKFEDDFPVSQLPKANNLWFVPGYKENLNHDAYYRELKKNGDISKMWTFTSFPSSKSDPTSREVSVCQIGCGTRAQVDKYWKGDKQRTEGYQEFKDEVMKHMEGQFVEAFPQYKDKIVHKLLGTPLTMETYYGRRFPYGTQLSTKKVFDTDFFLKTETPVNGLWITGQDIVMPGIVSAIGAGYLTAMKVSGNI